MQKLILFFQFLILVLASSTMADKSQREKSMQPLESLRGGDSLRVEESNRTFLASPNGTFFAGFRSAGTNAFCFCVWFARSEDKTVVWTANRDAPVNGRISKLTLTKSGNIVLTDSSGSAVWSTHTNFDSTAELRLLETGNLVLSKTWNPRSYVWESFDSPTDTLLPSQLLVKGTTLVSARTRRSFSSGVYNLKFDDNNVLNLIYNGGKLSSIYWPRLNGGGSVFATGRTPYNSSRIASLNELGEFSSSDLFSFRAFDYRTKKNRRLTLDSDGVLRLYSLEERTGLWTVSWVLDRFDFCRVDGICGEYGICGYDHGNVKPKCYCPDRGFERRDLSDWSKGCKPLFEFRKSNTSSEDFEFLKMINTDYYGYDLGTWKIGISLNDCRNICLVDPVCKGFGYSSDGFGQCFPKSLLTNGYRLPSSQSVTYIKVPRSKMIETPPGSDLNCSGSEVVLTNNNEKDKKGDNGNGYVKYLMAFVGSFGVIEVICLGLWWWFIYRVRVNEEVINMGYMALAIGFKRFKYSELKMATKNFKDEIGKGGFGSVYKGVLKDGRVVAVKRLEGVLQGNSEFWAEVSIIGNINHKNLVKLWGFCAEERHKLLVYEFFENGSLDKILFRSDPSSALGLDQRFSIALGTAKGLSYLHEECLEWVLHCDVKPQNILLDDKLEPKVADFGMSKLFKNDNNIENEGFSRVRGTRGYLAPEWTMNLKIDAKADVYSYGIVVLELLSGKCVAELLSATSQEGEFNHWLHWMTAKIKDGNFGDVIDPQLVDFDRRKVERLVKVALLCVQDDRNLRPAMSKVIELLLEANEEKDSETNI